MKHVIVANPCASLYWLRSFYDVVRGGMMVIHIVIGMFTSNPMIPQYLNNNMT